MKTKKPGGGHAIATYLLVLAGVLLVYAVILQVWISLRVPLWGDEFDTIAPAFRNWRGGHSFWWQIGQYNANPPGDNLVLRGYHRSGWLPWLRAASPELFWRLPYILVFTATLCSMFYGAWRWTGSTFVAFLAFAATISSPGIMEFGNVVRFYIWLAFFTTVLLWQFLFMSERNERRKPGLHYAFSLVASIGVCFHLAVAAIAYFFLCYSVVWLAFDLYKARVRTLKRAMRFFPRLLAGALPIIVYKVELKHWLFIPHPWAKDSPWTRLAERGFTQAFMQGIAANLPGQLSPYWLSLLVLLLGAATIFHAFKRRPEAFAQGCLLFLMLFICPIVLFISAAQRNYDLSERHWVFEVPVVICTLVYLWKTGGAILRKESMLNSRPGLGKAVLAVLAGTMIFADTFSALTSFAASRGESTPARVTYPLLAWRQAYLVLPGRRELVIIGSRPDEYSAASDQGEYRAGIMKHYTDEFSPLFYSVLGSFNSEGKPDKSVAERVEAHPAHYDFLLFDNVEKLQKMFPRLPWSSWHCTALRGGSPLSFCRI